MSLSDTETALLQAQFLDMLDAEFRRYGVQEGLPRRLQEAVAATPRHSFVHRFRIDNGPLRDRDADPGQNLPAIYSDAVMRHVDAAGALLPSSNSQPSYILYLLQMLRPERGQTILEIGSGSGWLAAVMARLIGPEGRVVGIELIPELAAQSRADLAALGIDNVEIIAGDGAQGHAPGAPYDRGIITAATWDVPPALFDQVAEGGLILVPIELRGGNGCEVTVLRRRSDVFVAERAVRGWFVPLLGRGQDRTCVAVQDQPDRQAIARFALPLGVLGEDGPAPVASQFCAFLGRTEPGFVTCAPPAEDRRRPEMPLPPFGLWDEVSGSLALWQAGEIVCYRGREAASLLARAYARWAALGLPGMGAFHLEVHRAATAPVGNDRLWIESRGATRLAWHLRPEIGNWQALNAAGIEVPVSNF